MPGQFFKVTLFSFAGFLVGLDLSWFLGRSAWIDMRFHTGGFIPVGFLTGVAAGCCLKLHRSVLILVALGALMAAGFWVVNDLEQAAVLFPILIKEGLRMGQANSQPFLWAGMIYAALALVFMSLSLAWPVPAKPIGKAKLFWSSLPLLGALLVFLSWPPAQFAAKKMALLLSAGNVQGLRDYILSFGLWAPVISALIMVFQAVVAPLPAFVVTFANGLLFGVFWGALLSWSSAMLGAALCFALAKLFGRPLVERMVGQRLLEMVDSFFKKYGKHAILVARLVPVISFDAVSYAAGLTAISFFSFWMATGLGQIPATILYSYLGRSLTGSVYILFLIFVVFTSFLIIGAALRKWLAKRGSVEAPSGREPQPDKA